MKDFLKYIGNYWMTGIFLFFLFPACKEVGPDINLTGEATVDTTYISETVETPQQKIVLLEEFTGVRCINCPEAHELVADLESQHGGRFVSVSLHSDYLATPHDGDPDLRIEEAQQLEDFLGSLQGKPGGGIDRRLFSGEQMILTGTSGWAGYVSQELDLSAPVNIHLVNSYSSNNRTLSIQVTLHYTAALSQDNRLTVMLIEDGIIAAQTTHSGLIDNYVQNNVLRDVVTSFNGDAVNVSKEKGRVVIKTLNVSLKPEWQAENMSVVAFVHNVQDTKEVLQAASGKLIP